MMAALPRLLWLALGIAQAHADMPMFQSESGNHRLGYESRLEPIVINRIHAWELHLETADGEPVTGAAISVQGGMPAHDHGLPTEPRVTRELGGGRYLLEGMRFHMNGFWEITIRLEAAGERDVVIVPLRL